MDKPCSCKAMYRHDWSSIHEHCKRYFIPVGWGYCETPKHGIRPSLILQGRCKACGGSIEIGYPVPAACEDDGERYHFLFRQLQTWRPYADLSENVLPAAAERLAWYEEQEERTTDGWAQLLLDLLPEAEAPYARLWLSGYRKRQEEQWRGAWPIGSVARFKQEAPKLKCGHCGLALGRHVVDLGVYYHCERRAWNSGAACLGARLFEDDLIRTVLASIRFQARLAGKAEKRLDKLENAERRERESLWEQRRRIQMKLDHLTTQKAEAFLLFNQGDLTQKTYDAKCAKLDKTILEQRTKLLDMSGTQTGTQDGAVLHCREDIARLKELSHLRTLNRQTVEKLIQSIRVYDGKRIEIVWNFSDSYMKLLTGEEQNHEG